MKYLKLYEQYIDLSELDKFSNIISRLSKNGIDSITDEESNFIKRYKDKLRDTKEIGEIIDVKLPKQYKDDIFDYTLNSVIKKGNLYELYGKFYKDDETIRCQINYDSSTGIIDSQTETTDGKTIWDFYEGFEYELDSFLNDVIIPDVIDMNMS